MAAQTTSRADTLTGRVTALETGAPISGATIFVTRGPDRLLQQDTSRADGRWRVIFTPGTGDYLVFISSPGATSFRKRVTRAAAEQQFTVDAALKTGAVTQLAAVRVQAAAPRPERQNRTGAEPTVGSNERTAEGVFAAVSPTSTGNPMATAATIPGLNVGPNGISTLGAGGEQSLVTLNGLASGATVPREIRTRTRGTLSNFDPAIGGFSGALVAQELDPGRQDTRRTSSVSINAPALQTADPLARAYGMRPATLQASLGQNGTLSENRLFYTTAAQVSRRTARQASLLDAPTRSLALDGLDPADVAQVQQGLAARGLSGFAAAPSNVVDQLNLVGQIDRTPRGLHAKRVTGLVDAKRITGAGLSPTALPDIGLRETNVTAAAQYGSVDFIGTRRPYQNDFRASAMVQQQTRDAATLRPAGQVRVPDLVTDPTSIATPVPTLAFAGYNGPSGTRRTTTLEAADDLLWLRGGRSHLFKAHLWSRLDAVRDETSANGAGTFAFNSFADLQANRPASYSRTLVQPARDGMAWNGAAAMAHRWAPSRVFQLLWGARVDANRFLGTPAANPALTSALGVRTDRMPSDLTISPRIGATWYLVRETAGNSMTRGTETSLHSSLPAGMIRFGAGDFRGIYRAGMQADADGATGLPGSTQRLLCIGAGVPLPDWTSYRDGVGPAACASGAPSLAFSAPSVTLLGPAYHAPASARASLGWISRIPGVDYRIDATYALNRNQGSQIDRNLRATPAFTLASESGRPIYVNASDIDAGSGGASSQGSRISTNYGAVMERVGDLRGRAGNVTLSLTPDFSSVGNGDLYVNFNYTWASARAQLRGFDLATGGDPRQAEWARSPFDIRHQMIAQVGTSVWGGVGLSAFLRLESGLPFTPIIGGDINGDGATNDRAWIPTSDSPAFAGLLQNAPSTVARCLTRQRGTIAGLNSCEGPWSQSMELRVDLPGRMLGLPQRARVALQFANPIGAIDRALHGATGLRGWGAQSTPNPVLFVPRGFNAGTGQFTYDVNPQFGETRPSRLSRPIQPFGVLLDFRFDLSVQGEVQELRRQLKPGRGGDHRPRLSEDSLMARYQRSMPSVFVAVQALSDTLLLTATQIDSLSTLEARYRAELDTIYRPLVRYLAALGDSYDGAKALTEVQRVDSIAWDRTYITGGAAKTVLAPIQFNIVPEFLRRLMTEAPDAMRRDHVRYEMDVSPQGSSFSMSRR